MSDYVLVLSTGLMADSDGNTGKLSWYEYSDYNNVLFSKGYQRAAFYLELRNKTTQQTEWALVTTPNYLTTGDYKLSDLLQLGIPNPNADANGVVNNFAIQKTFSDMNVYYVKPDETATNMPILSVKAETSDSGYKYLSGQTGIVEMWPSDYGGGTSGNLTGIQQTGDFDWYDSGFKASGGFGSYQIHLYDTTATGADYKKYGQPLIVINSATGSKQIGIGTNEGMLGSSSSGTKIDWTFQYTNGVYDIKTLQIFALPNISADAMFWSKESGVWSDANWTNANNVALTTSPNNSSEVLISSGAVTVSAGSTAQAGQLSISSGAVVNINGTLNVTQDISGAEGSSINLSGSLSIGQGGLIPSLSTTGNASLSNSSTDTVLKIDSLTGAAGSSLTFNGTQFDIACSDISVPTLTIPADSAVSMTGADVGTVSSAFTGAGTVNKTGAGSLLFSGNNSGFTGAFNVSAGAFNVTNANAIPTGLSVKSGAGLNLQIGSGAFSQADYDALAADSRLESGSYLGVYNASDQVMPVTINGAKNFSKSGAGTLTIADSVNSGYKGTTRVFEGALQIGTSTQVGNLGGDFLIDAGAKAIFNVAAETNQTKTMTHSVSGAGTMEITGGTLQYSTSSPGISANVNIANGGRLLFDNNVSFRNANPITVDINAGGVLEYNVTSHATDQYHHYADGALISSGKETGAVTITGSGVFRKTGAGTLTAVYNILYPNSYSLSMTSGGWLDVAEGCFFNGGWINGAMFSANKGSLHLGENTVYHLWDGATHYFDSLTGDGSFLTSGNGAVVVGVAGNVNSAEFGVSNNTAVFNGCFGPVSASESRASNTAHIGDVATGALDNTMGLTKQGSGTQIMAGDNNYSGVTTVSAGTLQFGAGGSTGSIGTGNVSVASGANLVFNTTRNNNISAVLSGAGTVKQQGAGSTLTLSNAANTFTGSINVEAGRLTMGSAANAASLGGIAKINMSSGAELEYVVPTAATVELGAQTINGTGYTFIKSGEGRLNIGTKYNAAKTVLNGGTISMPVSKFNAQTIDVLSDSTLALPKAAVASPWTVTMYRWGKTAKDEFTHVEPTETSGATPLYTTCLAENWTSSSTEDLRVYTGQAGWDVWNADTTYSGAAKTAVPTVWDMSGAGNAPSGQTNTTRNYLSERATLSYTTTIQVLNDLTLDFGGSFDDRCAAYAIKLDADGNQVGDWITLTPMNWTSQTAKVSLTSGSYLLDVRVGDVAGGAYATGSVASPDGRGLGMGVRLNGGSLTGATYYALDIDPETGIVGLPDGSIRAVSTFAAPITLENDNMTIADGATLTIDNPYAETTAVTLKANIKGTGTVHLTNSSNSDIPFTFDGTTEGSLTTADNLVFKTAAGTSIGGDLTLGNGVRFTIDNDTAIGGDFIAQGAILTITQADGLDLSKFVSSENSLDGSGTTFDITFSDLSKSLGFDVLSTDLQNAKFLFTYNGPETFLDAWTFIESEDETASWLEADGVTNTAEFQFAFPSTGDFRGFAQFVDGKYQVVIGNSETIPEPSTWVLLVLGVAGLGWMRRKRKG